MSGPHEGPRSTTFLRRKKRRKQESAVRLEEASNEARTSLRRRDSTQRKFRSPASAVHCSFEQHGFFYDRTNFCQIRENVSHLSPRRRRRRGGATTVFFRRATLGHFWGGKDAVRNTFTTTITSMNTTAAQFFCFAEDCEETSPAFLLGEAALLSCMPSDKAA